MLYISNHFPGDDTWTFAAMGGIPYFEMAPISPTIIIITKSIQLQMNSQAGPYKIARFLECEALWNKEHNIVRANLMNNIIQITDTNLK